MRTTFLRQVYAPWLSEAVTLMGFALGIALLVALLLSNLALRPLEEISMQLDYWTAASESAEEEAERARQDTAARVSTKIEQIGQRMRNVEEVFSALKDNLDQILGNLQDGILLFTADGPRGAGLGGGAAFPASANGASVLGLHAPEIFDRSTVLGKTLQDAFDSARHAGQGRDPHRDRPPHPGVAGFHPRRDRTARDWARWSRCTISNRWRKSNRSWSFRGAWRPSGGSPPGVGHEVKNPINAIVVHLELLQNKLGDPKPRASATLR